MSISTITKRVTNQIFFMTKMSALIFTLMLVACASKPPIEKIAATSDPSEEISTTEQSLTEAREQQIDVFAPKNFSKANKSLNNAKESRADQDKNEKILNHVAESRAWLNQAKQKAQVSKTATAELEQARTYAVQSGAPQAFPKEFKKLESQTKSFTEDMEQGDLSKADRRSADLIKEYRALETKAVKMELLGMTEDNLKTAKEEGAKKAAPKSLSSAEAKFDAANKAIENNPRNTPVIQAVAEEALHESEHLLMVTRKVKGNQNASTEDLVLKSELQDRAISSLSEEKAAELAQMEEQNNNLSARTAATQARLLSLEEKQSMQTKINNVRDNFTAQEAEVLQDGDKILIRLKGMNFKSNQAQIEPQYYNLLNKVKNSLAELNASQVVIEGHTDSIGKADLNRNLSAKRAEAVEQYLISNNAVEAGSVEARGLGFEKPITENKTAQGRAQNRRIDLVVTTQ